jgi:hypothetical protein
MMLFILLFSSCTPSLTGNWRGDCVFSDLANNEDLTVFAQIDRDSNHLLRGTLQLTDWNEKKYTSTLTGDHSGKYVYIDGEITDFSQVVSEENTSSNTFLFFIESQRIGRILEGTCGIQSSNQASGTVSTGTLSGDIFLEK